jgi:CPA2 family monovalent cation:H+ antiporter-2
VSLAHLLAEAVVILAASVAVLWASHRLRLAPVVGLLLTGVLIGPSGLALVSEVERVEGFAEVGVVFLLFAIGLEFSLDRLREVSRPFFVGGSLQALATIALFTLAFVGLSYPLSNAVFFGFLAALSSTAIVLKLYTDRREMETPQGKIAIGILLFQDLLLVPMIVLTPVLGGAVEVSAAALLGRFAAALAAAAGVFLIARFLMPRVLHALAATRIRELFVLSSLLACLGLAWFTNSLGFSLALGAFLAGIVISESEYSHQVVADIAPFRDVFSSLFFISIGMLLDLAYAAENLPALLALAAGIVAVKLLATGLAVAALAVPLRIVAIVALALAQIGEFSFVLLEVGRRHALVDAGLYQLAIGAAILTMLATPLLVARAPELALRLAAWRRPGGAGEAAPAALGPVSGQAQDHVVVVGFGAAGRTLAKVLREARIPYRILELNGEAVRAARAAGEPILFGDATRREILAEAGVGRAEMVVFVISDLVALRHSIRLTRQLHPAVYILVRTRLQSQIEELRRCGADEVVAEEFETSIEIFTRVLERYHVPRNLVRAQTRVLRGEGYRMLRAPSLAEGVSEAVLDALAAGTTDLYRVERESALAGHSLRALDLRRASGATVIAVVRGETSHTNPAPDLELAGGDCLVLVGSHAEIDRAFEYLDSYGAPAPSPSEAAQPSQAATGSGG